MLCQQSFTKCGSSTGKQTLYCFGRQAKNTSRLSAGYTFLVDEYHRGLLAGRQCPYSCNQGGIALGIRQNLVCCGSRVNSVEVLWKGFRLFTAAAINTEIDDDLVNPSSKLSALWVKAVSLMPHLDHCILGDVLSIAKIWD